MANPDTLWNLTIKYGTQQLEISLPASSTVQKLQEQVQELTGAFVRKQKLIYKGKVLPANVDLVKAGLSDGAKLMLLLSDSTAVATQGQQALQQQKKARQDEAAQRVQDLYTAAKGGSNAASTAAAAAAAAGAAPSNPSIDWSERQRAWEKTGIIAVRDLALRSLPADLFTPPGLSTARLADLSHNRLTTLPACITTLNALHTLRLDHNCLTSPPTSSGATGDVAGGLPWECLSALNGLTSLTLDGNQLEELPEGPLGRLTALQVLSVCGNRLRSLPASFGSLGALRLLAVDGNRLEQLPDSLGECSSLMELSAEGNSIRELPAALARLTKLRSVRLDGNRISSVPTEVLLHCVSLASLSVQGNPITADQLRSTPGFGAYDSRRVALVNKQLEAGVLGHEGRSFSEGAEDRQWSRWAGGKGGQGG